MKPPSEALANLQDEHFEQGLIRYLRTLFGFLVKDFGCVELPLRNRFEIRYANSTTLVIIQSEREGPWVGIDRSDKPRNEENGELPLWVIMAIRESSCRVSVANRPMIDKFLDFARVIPECAADLMNGDFSIRPSVIEFCDRKRIASASWEKNMYLLSAISKADEAFRNKDFANVVNILKPYEADLTKAQAAKLAFAKSRIEG